MRSFGFLRNPHAGLRIDTSGHHRRFASFRIVAERAFVVIQKFCRAGQGPSIDNKDHNKMMVTTHAVKFPVKCTQ